MMLISKLTFLMFSILAYDNHIDVTDRLGMYKVVKFPRYSWHSDLDCYLGMRLPLLAVGGTWALYWQSLVLTL